MSGEFDYVVSGAGSGRCAVAARLSEDRSARVLLIESGGSNRKLEVKAYVAAGFPLEGITEFWRKWFAAWNDDSPDELEECWTHDLVWTISNTGQSEYHGRDDTVELARFGYMFAREHGFYPWDGTDTHLPYYDFFKGVVRAAFPYSGAARFFCCNVIPWPRKPIRGCGVDRYILRKEAGQGKIARIDTDQDISATIQMLPFADAATRFMAWLVRTLQPGIRRQSKGEKPVTLSEVITTSVVKSTTCDYGRRIARDDE